MKPVVTPIFPRNNGIQYPQNLPIRKTDSKEHMLNSGGFCGQSNHEIMHNHSSYQPPPPINCISIAQHIDGCPICSRLYDTDKTLYILAIIGLLILCFLMVKRIVKL
ncbi:hypothetical protein IIV25_033L [Invertebrate iridovirus 25]|uniref:Uncharacterized protein n=1 Tax=Invertebrate iridovirus 25 TaxID=1301280 RepID=W8W217_9VIRU|nr:hypothetical protein IIV25_033L [Invertebrate iridovirus 25]CCV02051.1 hypothetical protein IIV25_033L [Invertebrate iridovirus 25]